MLKCKPWSIGCNRWKWTVGLWELWLFFVVMLCSTALLLVVMNLAIASCGWLWLVMDGYVFGWLWFIVRDLCQTYVVSCFFWHLVPIEGARFQWWSLFWSGGGAVHTEGGKNEKNEEERKTIKMFVIFFCVCVFLGEELFYRYWLLTTTLPKMPKICRCLIFCICRWLSLRRK